MLQTDNLNIESVSSLITPAALKAELPLSERAADTVVAGLAAIEGILTHPGDRYFLVVGPCSIHNVDAANEYARRLKLLSEEVEDRLLLVMRAYFEKPRTVLGWKGLIYDPDLNGSCNIDLGLRVARRFLLDSAEIGLPAATELLEPVIPQYITDLVCWAAIGARTAESQTHRQMASGLSMPTGFKNATDGSLTVAVEAIRTAVSQHAFIGITGDGRAGLFRTRGNSFGHLVLRGGLSGPNHGAEYVAFAREMMKKAGLASRVLIDCSHGNSGKRPERQAAVFHDVLEQIRGGDRTIVGMMLESYLQPGSQGFPERPELAAPDVSVTDGCIGWEETASLIREAYAVLGEGR